MGRSMGRSMGKGLAVAGLVAALAAFVRGGAGPADGIGAGGGTERAEAMCRPAPTDAPTAARALERAVAATGSGGEGNLLRFRAVERQVQDFQSDRTYPPYFAAFSVQEIVYGPAVGVERIEGSFLYPTTGPGRPTTVFLGRDAAFARRGGELLPAPFYMGVGGQTRLLNPWAVLHDWRDRIDRVAVVGVCPYRDQERLVLEAPGEHGPERLFLDRDTGLPVKLDRVVPHVTWGQQHEEVLWSVWHADGGGRWFPLASFRMADGKVVRERTVGEIGPVDVDSIPLPSFPETSPMVADPWLEQYTATPPDTQRVADGVWLLTHRMYNGALVGVGDTVYVMDATLSEARARQDSAWVERLFPDHEHVRLVVTDLAWPHVGGVRFWVARGASVVSHGASEPFLRELVAREWTLRPDALEAARDTREPGAVMDFLAVPEAGLELGGGAVRLTPIDGIGGEGAVTAWMPGAGFLWAGDYIQTVDVPSLYATEVVRSVERAEIAPERVAAQHLPLTEWSVVREVNGGG